MLCNNPYNKVATLKLCIAIIKQLAKVPAKLANN